MTYLQPISPQEFLLKIPVQTITVVVTRSAFWTAKTWLCVILDSLMEFVGFSQQVRKFLKVQAKKNLWYQFNEFYIKMSFLNTNSDDGKYTSKKKIPWNWFISFDEFFWHRHFFLIFQQCVSGCCYHRIFSCSELSITTFHSFFLTWQSNK